MHNGLFSQNVTEGSLLPTLRGVHPEHYLIPAQGYPNMASPDMHLFDLQVAARFACFCFCCLIYDNPSQVMLWGQFLIYNYFFKNVNHKCQAPGDSESGRSCQNKSMLSRFSLEHRCVKSLFFRQEISAIAHFACKMYF